MSIRSHTFFYYLLFLAALLIQPVRSQGILGMASGGMANNPIVSGELGGMQAGLSGAFFGFVVEKAAAEAAGADVTFQFQGARAWFSLADLFRTTEQEQNLMKGILQLEVDTQNQTLTGSVITPEPSATMPGVIIYPSMPVPDDPPATSDISLVNQSPILSRINSAILNLIKTVLQSGEWTDTAEVQCRTRYTASNTPIPEPTSTPDPVAVLKEDERICDVFYNDPFPESFSIYSTDEKNGDLTVEVHNAIGDVLAINPSSTTSSGYQTATLKYQPRQVPTGIQQSSTTTGGDTESCSSTSQTEIQTSTSSPNVSPPPDNGQPEVAVQKRQSPDKDNAGSEVKRLKLESNCDDDPEFPEFAGLTGSSSRKHLKDVVPERWQAFLRKRLKPCEGGDFLNDRFVYPRGVEGLNIYHGFEGPDKYLKNTREDKLIYREEPPVKEYPMERSVQRQQLYEKSVQLSHDRKQYFQTRITEYPGDTARERLKNRNIADRTLDHRSYEITRQRAELYRIECPDCGFLLVPGWVCQTDQWWSKTRRGYSDTRHITHLICVACQPAACICYPVPGFPELPPPDDVDKAE